MSIVGFWGYIDCKFVMKFLIFDGWDRMLVRKLNFVWIGWCKVEGVIVVW